MNAMKTLGFAFKHAETLWKVVAAVILLVSFSYIILKILPMLNILNGLIHLSTWTRPFIIFRGNFKIFTDCVIHSENHDQMSCKLFFLKLKECGASY
jgi:hypothetical protein